MGKFRDLIVCIVIVAVVATVLKQETKSVTSLCNLPQGRFSNAQGKVTEISDSTGINQKAITISQKDSACSTILNMNKTVMESSRIKIGSTIIIKEGDYNGYGIKIYSTDQIEVDSRNSLDENLHLNKRTIKLSKQDFKEHLGTSKDYLITDISSGNEYYATPAQRKYVKDNGYKEYIIYYTDSLEIVDIN